MSVDTIPPPAPTDTGAAADTGSITSPTAASTNGGGATSPREGEASNQFTLRALISSKEAGIIIGKAGKNVADIREATGCRAGVSKVVPGVHERILTVTGALDGVGKAYGSILQNLAENPSSQTETVASGISPNISIKLLVANATMGSIIGKSGVTIQALQANHKAKIVTVKEMLPNSTERIVSVEGPLKAVEDTVAELAKIVSEQDSTKLTNHIFYQPGAHAGNAALGHSTGGFAGFGTPSVAGVGFGTSGLGSRGGGGYGNLNGPRRVSGQNGQNRGGNAGAAAAHASQTVPTPSNPDLRTQNISIPSDMVGCIIGRGGSKINEIRLQSGAKISIAKDPHDETGERMFTITGSSESLEKALFLLYSQLEGEKEKRILNANKEAEEGQ